MREGTVQHVLSNPVAFLGDIHEMADMVFTNQSSERLLGLLASECVTSASLVFLTPPVFMNRYAQPDLTPPISSTGERPSFGTPKRNYVPFSGFSR